MHEASPFLLWIEFALWLGFDKPMSFTLLPGSRAPHFELPGSDGKNHSFDSLLGENGTVVFFTCNHCPYVVGSEARMVELLPWLAARGITMVAIHSNETKDHPEDAFPKVIERMQEKGFGWLSLNDEDQKTARDFGATRTPHYFLFDSKGTLVYSGRMDNAPRDASRVQTQELRDAVEDLVSKQVIRCPQTEALGCNIKWWDREKRWMPAEACDLDYLNQKFPSFL